MRRFSLCVLIAWIVQASAALAQPVTLISSDFSTNSISGTNASSVEWAIAPGITMLNSGNLTSLNGYNFGLLGNFSTNHTIAVNNNLNTANQTATQRGFSVGFTVTNGFSLGRLTVRAGHVNSTGIKQVYVSTLNYRIVKIVDSTVVASGSQSFDYAGTDVFFDQTFTLSGDLEAGVNYRLEVGMNNLVSGGAFAIYDGVTLEAWPEPGSNPVFAQRLNFAKYQRDIASAENGTYYADFAVDGIVSNFHSWRTGNVAGPHSLEITYPRPVTLGSAHLYSGLLASTTTQLWQNFRFQHHNGTTWIDIPGSAVVNNTSPEVSVLFSNPVTASRFRLIGSDSSSRAVRELAMFPPNPNGNGVEQGYPIGTDVNLDLAFKRPVVASSINGTQFAIHAVDGFVDNASRWQCNEGSPGQTLEIDLLADHAIGSAHLHSGDFATASSPLAAFTLEAWIGGGWQPIPGATITGNTALSRVITFSNSVVTNRVRLVTNDATSARVAALQIFPPRATAYPIGQDLRFERPPTAVWGDYSDASHRIRITSTTDRRLALINGSAVFSDNNAGAESLNWQLLLNHRDGSYRIRNVATGLCLGLNAISRNAGTYVVGENYTGMPHQNWFLEFVSPSRFRILNAYSGMALQSLGGNTTSGTPLVVTTPSASKLQQWDTARQFHYPKKGIAASANIPNPPLADPTATWMSHFQSQFKSVSWSYSWGRQRSDAFPTLGINQAFNPMQWGNFNFDHGTSAGVLDTIRNDLQSTPKPMHLMGFNEPDKTSQGNTPVATAIERWPRLLSIDAPLVSPAPASFTTTEGWLFDFYNQAETLGYRVDYTAVHWYAGPNAESLIGKLQEAYDKWKRPVWLTEFSTVRWSGTSTWTHADNFNFLAEFLWLAESLPWLHRYSLFNFRQSDTDPNQSAPDPVEAPRSNSIRSDGTLTPFGELYAGWDGVTSVVNHKSYHLHNKAAYRRVQNPVSTDTVAAVAPEDVAAGIQWFLVPGSSADTVRIVSIRDGRRLRFFTGTYVGLAPANNITPQSEWRLVAHQSGWYFLQHPSTNQRLRISGNTLVMGPNTGSTDDYQWRFVVPANSEPIYPDAPSVSAQGGIQEITLTWGAVSGATSYSVERFDSASQTWQSLATGITQTTWSNTGLAGNTTHSYRVIASNVLGSSPPATSVVATTTHPLSSINAWQAEYLSSVPIAQRATAADPDNDASVNLMEYAFVQPPLTAGANSFKMEPSSADTMVIVFPWNWRANDIQWRVRRGTDLNSTSTWPVAQPTAVQTVRSGDVDNIRLTFPIPSTQTQFFVLDVLTTP